MTVHRLCSVGECGRAALERGYCHTHYERVRRGIPLNRPVTPRILDPEQRLLTRRRVTASGCWEWTGSPGGGGYGLTRVEGRNISVHRLAYQLWVGPVPTGLHVLHRCDNRVCFNPEHLFVGTRFDNMQDAAKKGRLQSGERHLDAKLTSANVSDIRRRYVRGADPKMGDLAIEFGVSLATISDVILRKTWRDGS